ncbi:MAG: redoxin domain-containing protein [Lewinellaceae bacterium]|nr:redoxin domain-containing protein [Lewinellaceae bacterium]
MRKYRALVLLLLVAWDLRAQLPSGTIAPDFTATDITGQTWNLYDLLAEGKVVVLEISATWCSPCWAYHNGHAMHDFYNQHGPNGDNKATVLFIEGDHQTNVNCLYGSAGCNNSTPGNWVAGTPFPIINSHAIADSFQVSYYPSIFVICPNRKAIEVGQWNAGDLWAQAQTCPVAFGSSNAGIFDFSAGTPLREVCGDLEIQPAFTLINLGTQALSQAGITLHWNNTPVQTIEWSGNLGLYGEVPVAFDQYNINTAGTLEARITSVNYAPVDDDPANNVYSKNFTLAEGFNEHKVLLKIRTDQYGAETYWELRDEQGTVLDFGGNQAVGPNGGGKFTGITGGPGAYGNNLILRDTLHLPGPGCYSIHFVDAYGDGMCCTYGNGYYRLYNLDDPLTPMLSGGTFRAYDDRTFHAGIATAAQEPAAAIRDILLYPNPAGEQITTEFVLPQAECFSTTVINIFGQVVLHIPAESFTPGEHQQRLHIGVLPEGLYWMNFRADDWQISRKFVVRR